MNICAEKKIETGEEEVERRQVLQALEARAALYSMIGALFLGPLTQQMIDHLAESDFSSFSGLNSEFDEGIFDIKQYLRRRNTGTRETLAVDYTSTFIGTKVWDGKNAVPYESVYTSADGLLCRESYHQVCAAFRAAGFAKEDGDTTPDDHLGYICEFIAMLSRRAAAEINNGAPEKAAADIRVSRSFANDHILSWFDTLNSRAQKIIATRFYRGIMKMAHGYFAFDEETSAELADAIDRL